MDAGEDSRRLARRARTIIGGGHLEMGVSSDRRVVDRHIVEMDGSILCRAEAVAGDCLEPLMRGVASPEIDVVAVDVCPVPQPDRQRGSVWARGSVELVARPLPRPWRTMLGSACAEPVLRFRPRSVAVAEGVHGGTVPIRVPVELYRHEAEDGLSGWEGRWLPHVDAGHGDAIRRMAGARMALAPDADVHPLLVDEDGLVLRVYQHDSRAGRG